MVNPSGPLTATPEQARAWGYFGLPRSANTNVTRQAPDQAVGEVHYVVNWMADQMVRMGFRVLIDDSETWRLTLPDGTTVTSDTDQDDAEAPTHPANASRTLLTQVSWDDATIRAVTTNLFVAGEAYYLADPDDQWVCVSMIDPNLKRRVEHATLGVHALWPHPADPTAPGAPLFAVLSILDDMHWLSRLSRTQSANRAGMRGIIGIADQMSMAQGGDDFWTDFTAALSRPMDTPEDVAPVGLRGPAELVKPEGQGMGGLSWLIPDFPYDNRIDERMTTLVQRLAYGLPIPPEILLGMQAQSRATAFQVEENSYRAHVEPAAWTIAQVPQDALTQLLPADVGQIRVVPDPTALLARRVSTQNAFDAYDRGVIGDDYLREVLGIPARAKPEATEAATEELPEDPVTDDPAEAAAEEPVNAAVALPTTVNGDSGGERATPDDEYLADRLYRIDEHLYAELVGACDQAVIKAREKIGAQIRSNKTLKAQIPEDLTNDEVTVQVGAEGLTGLGVDVEKITQGAIESTLTWWRKRLARAEADTAAVLAQGGVTVEFNTNSATASETELRTLLTRAVLEPAALQPATIRSVITTAGS